MQKIIKFFIALLTLVFAFSTLGFPASAQAQKVVVTSALSEVTITSDKAKLDFPSQVTFQVNYFSSAELDQVILIYGTSAKSCFSSSARKVIQSEPPPATSLEWTWDLSRGGHLPPGAEIWWQWSFRLKNGESELTDIQRLPIKDPYYQWKELKKGSLTVQWTVGDQTFGAKLMTIAVSSLERIIKVTGVQEPAHILMIIYPSSAGMQEAVENLPDWSGGVAFPEYSVAVIGIQPGEDEWAAAVIPHELDHLVIEMRINNCTGNDLPTWLSEGLAVFAEGDSSSVNENIVLRQLEKGTLPALQTLNKGFPANSDEADSAYSQSGMVAAYLSKIYGPEKLDRLLGLVQDGLDIDIALVEVYGLDTNGIDQAWRASEGHGTMPLASTTQPSPTLRPKMSAPTLSLITLATTIPTQVASATIEPILTQLQAGLLTPEITSTLALPEVTRTAGQSIAGVIAAVAGGSLALVGIALWIVMMIKRRKKNEPS